MSQIRFAPASKWPTLVPPALGVKADDAFEMLYIERSAGSYTPRTVAWISRPAKVESFEPQLQKVFAWSRQRTDRGQEILAQLAPQFGFWTSLCGLHPEVTPRTFEIASIALHFSMLVTQQFKMHLDVPRPVEFSPLVQPIILTPAYSAYPMGHAVEAYMFAKIMIALSDWAVTPTAAKPVPNSDTPLEVQLNRLARRISENRVIAGVHFPVDAIPAYVLADALASFFLARCGATLLPKHAPREFIGDHYDMNQEIDPVDIFSTDTSKNSALKAGCAWVARRDSSSAFLVERSETLNALWRSAVQEVYAYLPKAESGKNAS